MKTKWNQLLASGLALTGAVALLAACDKTESPPPPPAPKVEASPPPPVAAVEPTPPPAPAQPEVVDDATLTTRVKAALLGDPATQALAINVDSREGVVQLSGFVESQAQTDKAAEIVQAVPGVRSVDNKLDMRTGAQAPAGKVGAVDDSAITNQIKEALLGDPYMNNIDVAVVTRNGEVQLSGFVPNQEQADDVLAAAHKVEGVKNVVSTLSIGSPTAGGGAPEEPPSASQPAEPPANQPAAGQ